MALKGEGKGPLPPLLSQYVELVEQVPDYLLLFQVGDFYECFGEDAERLARLLGLVLTRKPARDFTTPTAGCIFLDQPPRIAPRGPTWGAIGSRRAFFRNAIVDCRLNHCETRCMAGLPVRSADRHIERLLKLGVRVAVADQVENPAEAQGLVRREVTQLITPGTVTDKALLQADATYLAAVATGDGYGLALLDVSTGECRGARLYAKSSLFDELQRYRPAEVLLAPELRANEAVQQSFASRFPTMLSEGAFDPDSAREVLEAQFGTLPTGLDGEALTRATGAVLAYARETQRGTLPQVTTFVRYDPGAFMQLDEVTLSTLEVFEPRMPGGRTLFETLDQSRSAPGRRLLKAWLHHPLLDVSLITPRLEAVEALTRDAVLRSEVRKALHELHDLERLATRLATGRPNARDLIALARSAALVPTLQQRLAGRPERALQAIVQRGDELAELRTLIDASLIEDPPLKVTEGGLLRDGFDGELDRHRQAAEQGRTWIVALEGDEREASGIPSLKVGFVQEAVEAALAQHPLAPPLPELRAFEWVRDAPRSAFPALHHLGRYRDLYLLAESGGNLWVVDQHAAHERILFEELEARYRSEPPIELAHPELLALAPEEAQRYLERRQAFADIGLTLEPFGADRWRLRTVPAFLAGAPQLIAEAVKGTLSAAPLDEAWRAVLGRLACLPAIKAGHPLAQADAQDLLDALARCHTPWACPHGRPTALVLSELELARHFGQRGVRASLKASSPLPADG